MQDWQKCFKGNTTILALILDQTSDISFSWIGVQSTKNFTNFGGLKKIIISKIEITLPLRYEILNLPLFLQLMMNFSLACELLLSQIFLNKCSASTTESTIPFAKKIQLIQEKKYG